MTYGQNIDFFSELREKIANLRAIHEQNLRAQEINEIDLLEMQYNGPIQATDGIDYFIYDFARTDNDMQHWGLERFEIQNFDPNDDKIIFVNSKSDFGIADTVTSVLEEDIYSNRDVSERGENDLRGIQEMTLVSGELIISHEVSASNGGVPTKISRDGISVKDEHGDGVDFGDFNYVADSTSPVSVVGTVLVYDNALSHDFF